MLSTGVSVKDASLFIGVSERQIYRYLRAGKIRVDQVCGKKYLLNVVDVHQVYEHRKNRRKKNEQKR